MCNPVNELVGQMDAACFTPGRPEGARVLVLHNTCGPQDKNDPTMGRDWSNSMSQQAAHYLLSNDRRVSVHYVIGGEQSGTGDRADIYHLAHESDTCYHVGGNPPEYPSHWLDPQTGQNYGGFALNGVAIGIELVGQSDESVGPRQRAALLYLLTQYAGPNGDQGAGILGRHPILKDVRRIQSHKSLEPGDRTDGENYLLFVRNIAASL